VRVIGSNDVTDSIPTTGSLGGELAVFRARKGAARGSRGKKVYGITERGHRLFEELLAAESVSSDDERAFNLRLAFARYLPAEARLGMLERRRAHLLERLARTRAAIRNGWERLDAYSKSLIEHGNETTERDISWLDRLIARERDASSSVGAELKERQSANPAPSATAPLDWAVSSAPTMPAPPAQKQGGNTP
jgi:DNA-binding PadR family transcriptional regulator